MNKLLLNTKAEKIMDPYRIHYVIITVLSLAAGFLLYALLPENNKMWLFVNADTRYMTAIYTDLFVHHTGLHGWHLPSSPNFFPEMLVFSLVMAIFKGPMLSAMVYGVLQLSTVIILVNILIRTFDPGISVTKLYLLSLAILILPFSSILGEDNLLPSQLLLNGYHCGFFINSLLATIFYMKYLRYHKGVYLVLLSALSMVAVISDKLFMIGFTGPLLVFSVLNYFHSSKKKAHLVVSAVIIASTVTGLALYKLIENSDAITFFSTSGKTFNFQNIGPSITFLAAHMKDIIIENTLQGLLVLMSSVYLIGSPAFLFIYLRRFLGEPADQVFHRQYKLLLYLSLFTYMVLLTPVINGYYLGPASIRYNYSSLIMGSLGFLYLLFYFIPNRQSPPFLQKYFSYACSLCILILLLVTGIKKQEWKGLSEFANYYSEPAMVLDSLKNEHQLKYGIGEYWQAHPTSQFSRNGIRLYAVFDKSFKPWYHAANEDWYHDGGKGTHANPVFNYLVVNRFQRTEKLHDIFGSSIDTISVGQDPLVIKVPDFKFDRETREIYLLNQL